MSNLSTPQSYIFSLSLLSQFTGTIETLSKDMTLTLHILHSRSSVIDIAGKIRIFNPESFSYLLTLDLLLGLLFWC